MVVTTTEAMKNEHMIAIIVAEGSPSRCSALGDGWGLKLWGKVKIITVPKPALERVLSLRYCLHMNVIISSSAHMSWQRLSYSYASNIKEDRCPESPRTMAS